MMKIIRYVLTAVLILAISGAAHAAGFQFTVLDPAGGQTSFPLVTPGVPFQFSFFDCPGNITGDGCFAAFNNSSSILTGFTAVFTATTAIPSPNCPNVGQGPLFSAFSITNDCSVSGDTMTVDLTGGPGIQPFSTFWLVESGLPDTDFLPNAGTATVTAVPEPGSIWMALTGISSLGYVVRRRRAMISR
jgi:hypothetical protein